MPVNNVAISNIETHLGLPNDSGYSFTQLLSLARRFESASENDSPITPLAIMYYLDKFGDFTSESTTYEKMVNKIFTGLNTNGIMEIVPYIEFVQNNYEEEDGD